MVSIDRKTGLIDAGDGWSIKMSNHSLDVFNANQSYNFSCEIVDKGLKVVIFNDLSQKGVDAPQENEVVLVVTKTLNDMGLIVEIE